MELELSHIRLELAVSRRLQVEQELLELRHELAALKTAFSEHRCPIAEPKYWGYLDSGSRRSLIPPDNQQAPHGSHSSHNANYQPLPLPDDPIPLFTQREPQGHISHHRVTDPSPSQSRMPRVHVPRYLPGPGAMYIRKPLPPNHPCPGAPRLDPMDSTGY